MRWRVAGGLLHLNEKEKISCRGGEERRREEKRGEPELTESIAVCRNQGTTGEETIKKD